MEQLDYNRGVACSKDCELTERRAVWYGMTGNFHLGQLGCRASFLGLNKIRDNSC